MRPIYLKSMIRSSSGQGLVEFSLILPLFLLIAVCLFDVSRMINTKQTIDRVVREGARAGVVKIADEQAVSTAIAVSRQVLSDMNMGEPSSVQAAIVQVQGVDAVRVSVSYVFQPSIEFGGLSIIPAATLTSVATMRKEG